MICEFLGVLGAGVGFPVDDVGAIAIGNEGVVTNQEGEGRQGQGAGVFGEVVLAGVVVGLEDGGVLQAIEPAIELWVMELAGDAEGALLEEMVKLLAALEGVALMISDGQGSPIEDFGLVAARAMLEEAEMALRDDD